MMTIRRAAFVTLVAALPSLTAAATMAPAKDKPPLPSSPATCSQLATDPALGLAAIRQSKA
jgi:hypothetical protein